MLTRAFLVSIQISLISDIEYQRGNKKPVSDTSDTGFFVSVSQLVASFETSLTNISQ